MQTVRPATAADAAAICAIYNPYIADTTITFEEAAVSEQEMAQRILDVGAAGLPWLALEADGKLAGRWLDVGYWELRLA